MSAVCGGADIMRLSRQDLIQICGVADGIRLYNALHVRCRLVLLCFPVFIHRRRVSPLLRTALAVLDVKFNMYPHVRSWSATQQQDVGKSAKMSLESTVHVAPFLYTDVVSRRTIGKSEAGPYVDSVSSGAHQSFCHITPTHWGKRSDYMWPPEAFSHSSYPDNFKSLHPCPGHPQ